MGSVGGNSQSVGEKLNRGSETVENTGVQKSASVHLLHLKAPTLFEHKSPSGRCFSLRSNGFSPQFESDKKHDCSKTGVNITYPDLIRSIRVELAL